MKQVAIVGTQGVPANYGGFETLVENIIAEAKRTEPDLMIVDSIQTMQHSDISSSPGSIVQVRESTNLLLRTGKSLDIPVILVGHVKSPASENVP